MHTGTPEPLSTHTHTPERTARGQAFPLSATRPVKYRHCSRRSRALALEGPRALLPIGQENQGDGFTIDPTLSNALRSSSRALLRPLFFLPFSLFAPNLLFSRGSSREARKEGRKVLLRSSEFYIALDDVIYRIVSFLGVWRWRLSEGAMFNCKSMRREKERESWIVMRAWLLLAVVGGGFDEGQGFRWRVKPE